VPDEAVADEAPAVEAADDEAAAADRDDSFSVRCLSGLVPPTSTGLAPDWILELLSAGTCAVSCGADRDPTSCPPTPRSAGSSCCGSCCDDDILADVSTSLADPA
jgi:hypothetical protein